MEKIRKYIIPLFCLALALGGSISYLKQGNVVLERATGLEQVESVDTLDTTKTEESTKTQDGKVDLNTATSEELQIAPGIGPAKAEAIIKYRTEYGKFSSVDELIEITGIGEKTLAKIRDYYVVK